MGSSRATMLPRHSASRSAGLHYKSRQALAVGFPFEAYFR